MLVFHPRKGFKAVLHLIGVLTLLLMPTLGILISAQAPIKIWLFVLLFGYLFTTGIYLVVQLKTRYWIDNNNLHYKSLFMKGAISIHSIRKLEVNSTNWLSNKPATTFNKGITIFYNKFDDIFFRRQCGNGRRIIENKSCY